MRVRKLALSLGLFLIAGWLTGVISTLAQMPGPGPCYCDPGTDPVCIVEDWLHQGFYLCGEELREGRLP